MVVIGIIGIATAMALPAINQFLKGQKLVQAGRLIQSAFNEARRSAITQRAKHWIFIGKIPGVGGSPDSYALAHYREGKGWDSGTMVRLPSSIEFVLDPSGNGTAGTGPNQVAYSTTRDSKVRIPEWKEGLPSDTDPTFFDANKIILTAWPTYEFRKDGTIAVKGATTIPPLASPDLYDMNTTIEPGQVNESTPTDFILKQGGEPEKRCFVDIDENTGRVRFRVFEAKIN